LLEKSKDMKFLLDLLYFEEEFEIKPRK